MAFQIEDSGSRNGTFLNGQLVTAPQFLKQGDRIRVSDVEFVFQNSDVPGFLGNEVTFDGANFGIMMYDEHETEQLSGGSSSGSAKVEFRSSIDGFQMSATPEAKLEALKQIISNLGEALAVDEVLPKILSSLFDLFPAADRGFIVMQGEDGSLIPRWVKTRAAHDETETIRISRTIVREVMKSKEAILSMDAAEDSRFDSSQSIADFSIRSMICAPLMDADNNAFGVLQIDSTQGRGQFREEDTDLLAGVAALRRHPDQQCPAARAGTASARGGAGFEAGHRRAAGVSSPTSRRSLLAFGSSVSIRPPITSAATTTTTFTLPMDGSRSSWPTSSVTVSRRQCSWPNCRRRPVSAWPASLMSPGPSSGSMIA